MSAAAALPTRARSVPAAATLSSEDLRAVKQLNLFENSATHLTQSDGGSVQSSIEVPTGAPKRIHNFLDTV